MTSQNDRSIWNIGGRDFWVEVEQDESNPSTFYVSAGALDRTGGLCYEQEVATTDNLAEAIDKAITRYEEWRHTDDDGRLVG